MCAESSLLFHLWGGKECVKFIVHDWQGDVAITSNPKISMLNIRTLTKKVYFLILYSVVKCGSLGKGD